MNAMEFESKSGGEAKFGLSITLTVNTQAEILKEFREVKAAILQWIEDRGDRANLLLFVVQTPEAEFSMVSTFITQVAQSERDLSPLLSSVHIELSCIDRKSAKKRDSIIQ